MEVRTVNGNEIQPAGEAGGLNGNAKLAEDFDAFLSLLVTQLENQDPLEPLKAQEFTNQLVQFSSVEQALATNSKLDELIDLQNGNRASTAVNYIGREVEAEGSLLALQDGAGKLAYDLHDNAHSAIVQIANGEGNVVRTLQVDGGAGRHEVTWDGADDNGRALPDGAYAITLLAVDREGATVEGDTSTFGKVSGFELGEDGVTLNIGEIDVGLDKVKAVHETSGRDA